MESAELKTLDDFQPDGKFGGIDIQGQSIRIPKWMLRENAINWIREMQEAFIQNHETVNIGGVWFTHAGLAGAISILFKLHNLTSEEVHSLQRQAGENSNTPDKT
jgi:hypothetical protein